MITMNLIYCTRARLTWAVEDMEGSVTSSKSSYKLKQIMSGRYYTWRLNLIAGTVLGGKVPLIRCFKSSNRSS